MKRFLRYLAIAVVAFVGVFLLQSCDPSDRLVPIPVGGGGEVPPAPAPNQPAATPAPQLPLTTAWTEQQTRSSPSPSPTDSAEPAAEPSPEASTIPQSVMPDDGLTTIPGVREVHYASTPLTCYQMEKKFQEQGLRLELKDVVSLDQPGRSGRARKKSKRIPGRKDISSRYGSMFVCLFEGLDAVEDRYNFNDPYVDAGLNPPDFNQERHPNDYRPDPNTPVEPDRSNPNRRSVPDPDPNRPNPYKDLPF
ncbi:MAG: hypothetical protein ACAF41_34300 (plasmid) [Leptolyngbya sp. BL-A-14]